MVTASRLGRGTVKRAVTSQPGRHRISPLPAVFHHEMYRFGLYRRPLRGIVTTPLPVTAGGNPMGSRGRSIRLRIYFLVAIPLITMLGLFGYVAYTSINDLPEPGPGADPDQRYRRAADELRQPACRPSAARRSSTRSHPTSANLAAYQQRDRRRPGPAMARVTAALSSAGTKSSSTAAETAGIASMTTDLNGLPALRDGDHRQEAEHRSPRSRTTPTSSPARARCCRPRPTASPTRPASEQGLGLISAVNTQEDMSEQDAMLASALVSGSLTADDRVAFGQAAGRQQDDTLLYQELFTPAELKTYNDHPERAGARRRCRAPSTTIQQAVMSGAPLRQIEAARPDPASWQRRDHARGCTPRATRAPAPRPPCSPANTTPAIDAKRRLWAVSIVGAVGLPPHAARHDPARPVHQPPADRPAHAPP